MMTQKENPKFVKDFAFDFNNNLDELKKHLDDYAVALTFDTIEEYEVFRDECNRLKELEQSQIKQIKELQKQLEEKDKEKTSYMNMTEERLITELTNSGKNKKLVVDLICQVELSPIRTTQALSEALADLSKNFDSLSDVFSLVPKRYKEVLDGLNNYLGTLRNLEGTDNE